MKLLIIPLDEMKAEFEKLHRRIAELEAKLLEKSEPLENKLARPRFLISQQVIVDYPISISSLYL